MRATAPCVPRAAEELPVDARDILREPLWSEG